MAFSVQMLSCALALASLGAQESTPTPPARAIALKAGTSVEAQAEARVALVIGNSDYTDSPLKNPVNDARAIAETLSHYGFQVTKLENADPQQMDSGIRAFRTALAAGRGTGLFYFAGHGVSLEGKNYLLPVRQVFDSVSDVKFKAIDANFVLSSMEDAGARVSMMFLDACRNNPFGARGLFRSSAKGFASMDAPVGSLVSFATAPGSVAVDGNGINGLYTTELIRTLKEQDSVEVEQLLKTVSARVQQTSAGIQVPYRSSSLTGQFFFRPPAPPAEVQATRGTTLATPGNGAPPPTTAPMLGHLQVLVNVPAKVFVEGDLKGEAGPATPLNVKNLPIGEVTVRLEAPGFKPQTQSWNVEEGVWVVKKAVLVRVAPVSPEVAHPPAPVAPAEVAAPARVPAASPGPAPFPDLGGKPPVRNPAFAPPGQGPQEKDLDLGAFRIRMVLVPAGHFVMGSDHGETDEKPAHEVTLTRGFWMSKFQVTQAQWLAVMGTAPSKFKGPERPAENVSWEDAQAFLRKVKAPEGWMIRLPTEAEWEYACRAGSTIDKPAHLDDLAWNDNNSGKTTHPVGQKQPNAFGLHDMLGNVWEWCQNSYEGYPKGPVVDPPGLATGPFRILRGGSWYGDASFCRPAYRLKSLPNVRTSFAGFRVVAIPR